MERKEAIEVIKSNLPDSIFTVTVLREALETLIPELAESEDERMLREIKRYIKEQGDKPTGLPNGTVAVSDMLTWLEKQGEQKPVWSEEDRTMAFTLMRDIDQMSYISKEGKDERIGWLNSLDEKFTSTEPAWSNAEAKEDLFNYTNILSAEENATLENLINKLAVSGIKQYNTQTATILFKN